MCIISTTCTMERGDDDAPGPLRQLPILPKPTQCPLLPQQVPTANYMANAAALPFEALTAVASRAPGRALPLQQQQEGAACHQPHPVLGPSQQWFTLLWYSARFRAPHRQYCHCFPPVLYTSFFHFMFH